MNRKFDAHSAKKEEFIKPSSAYAPHGRALKRHSKQRNTTIWLQQLQKRLTNDRMIITKCELQRTKGTKGMEIKAYLAKEQGNKQITDHFRVKEFACKDGTPIVFVDDYLAVILEIARKKINKPIVITSGYRTISHNKKVGGAKYSYHTRGMAADIRVNGVTPKELAKVLNSIVPNSGGIIVYDNWVHFDTRNEKYRKGV